MYIIYVIYILYIMYIYIWIVVECCALSTTWMTSLLISLVEIFDIYFRVDIFQNCLGIPNEQIYFNQNYNLDLKIMQSMVQVLNHRTSKTMNTMLKHYTAI